MEVSLLMLLSLFSELNEFCHHQAFLIAFTSEFIPRLAYMSLIGNGTLDGYTNFTLSYAPDHTGEMCCVAYAF